MATQAEADRALAYHQEGLFQANPDLTKISVVESTPHSGDYVLEAGVVDLRSAWGQGANIPAELPVPNAAGRPTSKRIHVRVVESGELRPFAAAFPARTRPAQGGDSIGRGGGPDTGTLGSPVLLKGVGTGTDYFLSAWHVLVGAGGRLGSAVVQPGPGDMGTSPADDLGDLYWFMLNSELDVAVAKTAGPAAAYLTAGCRCNSCSYTIPATPTINSIVAKCGRTSGLTLGLIRSVNATVSLPGYPTGKRFFVNQIETTAMAWPADSGSILFNHDTDRAPIGLLLGGGNVGTYHNKLSVLFRAAFAARTETYSDGSTDSLPAVEFLSL